LARTFLGFTPFIRPANRRIPDAQPFANLPTFRHTRGYELSFIDGHAESWRLNDGTTQTNNIFFIPAANTDWIRLKQVTTIGQ
jgi:hypothetical protein